MKENIYLIYGENEFLIKKEIKKILIKFNILNNFDIIKYNYFDTSLLKIINDANTVHLFFYKKIIIINNFYFIFKNNKFKENQKIKINNNKYINQLINYILNPNKNNILIFILFEKNINFKLKISKFFLKFSTILKVNNFSDIDLLNFIIDYVKSKKGQIDLYSAKLILSHLPNNNFYIICNEINKLLLISNNLNKDIVKKNLTKYLDINIFDLINSLLNNDLNNFIIFFNNLMNKENLNFLFLITIIIKNISLLRNINILFYLNKNIFDISNILNINIHIIKEKIKFFKFFNIEKINKIILKLFKIYYNIKKGKINKNFNSIIYFIDLFF